MTRHLPAFIVTAAVACILLLAWSIRTRIEALRVPPEASVATPSPLPSPSDTPAATRPAAIVQRLAGIVLGSKRYAVVEQPDGTSDLYQPGEQVPGLGRLVAVEGSEAAFAGADGLIRLHVAPAPTATAAPATRVPVWTPRRVITGPTRPPVPVRTVGKSSP